MTDMPELTRRDFARVIPASVRRRLMRGQFESGKDVAALRRFRRLDPRPKRVSHAPWASASTLRNWEQDRRSPEGPAPHCSASLLDVHAFSARTENSRLTGLDGVQRAVQLTP